MDTTTVGVDLAKSVFVVCMAGCTGRIVERLMWQVLHPITRRHHAMCQLAGWTVAGVMLMLPGLHAMSMGQHGLLRGQRRMLPVRR